MNADIQEKCKEYARIFFGEFMGQNTIPIDYFKPLYKPSHLDFCVIIDDGPTIRLVAASDSITSRWTIRFDVLIEDRIKYMQYSVDVKNDDVDFVFEEESIKLAAAKMAALSSSFKRPKSITGRIITFLKRFLPSPS